MTIEPCLEVTMLNLSGRVKVHVRIKKDVEVSFKVKKENAEPGEECLQT